MPKKFADQRLSVMRHHAEMVLAFITDVGVDEDSGDIPDAEYVQQCNDAEELSDLILSSMTLTITGVADDGTITATFKLQDIDEFLAATSEEYLVAEEL
jgi:hypothetical protein|tara:strand:+ start:320 stop:616 length:297 start_codon:yes stop_codon:yes gene_type:complete